MLIVLSGIETFHKKFFAREIIAALNTFEYEGYTIDFSRTNIAISKDDTLLYKLPDDQHPNGVRTLLLNPKDGSSNTAGKAVLDAAQEMQVAVFNEGVRNSHYHNVFCDPLHDLGLTPESEKIGPDAPSRLYVHDHSYDTLLQNYQNRTFENFVITGIFSKCFIEKLKTDIGADNVLVLNILRHPSVAFLLNEKEPSYYHLKKPDLSRTPEMDARKLEASILNASIIKEMPGVITFKFEDILRDGKFTVMGKDIPLPPNYDRSNNWLTWWEQKNIVLKKIVTDAQLAEFNSKYSNFEPMMEILLHTDPAAQQEALDTFNAEYNANISMETMLESLGDKTGMAFRTAKKCLPFFNAINGSSVTIEQYDNIFPINTFEKLEYEPLTYDEVIKLS